jgi:hypothetical protein
VRVGDAAAAVALGALLGWGVDHCSAPPRTEPPACLSPEGCEILGELGKLKLQIDQNNETITRMRREVRR